MTNVVRPAIASFRPCLIWRSVEASIDEVASSRMSTRGSASSARAIAIRWRWPPRGLEDLLARGLRPGVGDVLGDGGAEEEGVVVDDGDLRAQGVGVDVAHVGTVDEHR